MKVFQIILIFLFLTVIVNGEDIKINKEIKNNATIGEEIIINIKITNDGKIAEFRIIETLPQGVILSYPKELNKVEKRDGLNLNKIVWDKKIEEDSSLNLEYKIVPEFLGEFNLLPTIVTKEKSSYLSNNLKVLVKCKSNNICENNENSLNCEEDCKKSGNDEICDYKYDKICDPDCTEDPDCGQSKSLLFSIGIVLIIVIILLIIIKRGKKATQKISL